MQQIKTVKSTTLQRKLPKKPSIDDITEIMHENESYNTLKDDKPGLPHKKTCRPTNS